MERLERLLSRPSAKPYRTRSLKDNAPFHFNADGYLDFSPGDVDNPKNWSNVRRWYITFVSVLLVVNATFASSAPSGCLESLSEEFNVSLEASGLIITLFLLGYVAGPLIWAPLSEFYGRRWIFLGTFLAYFAFNFLCAWAPNFAAMLVARFLAGTFVSAALSNSPGVMVDMWTVIERGNAMAVFSVMCFVGPALGPVTGGFIQLTTSWRWVFWELVIMAFASFLLLLTVPETLPATVLLRKARRIRKANIPGYENIQASIEGTNRSLVAIFRVALVRPWIILFDPISFMAAVYISLVYLLLYMLFSIFPIVFREKRGWNAGVSELPTISIVIGAFLGGLMTLYDSRMQRKRQEAGHVFRAEDRLRLGMIGGILFPVSMFWFAWTAEFNSIHWVVPTLAGVFLSTSIILIFVAYLNYVTDSYLMYAASALAANTVARSAAGAAAPLFTNYMFQSLGVGGGGSLIAGVGCLLVPVPFLFHRYGQKIRERSRFAPTPQRALETDNKDEAAGVRRRESDVSDDERDQSGEKGDFENDGEKELTPSSTGPISNDDNAALDRFRDAHGMERAEWRPNVRTFSMQR